jgi:hypothetical protein
MTMKLSRIMLGGMVAVWVGIAGSNSLVAQVSPIPERVARTPLIRESPRVDVQLADERTAQASEDPRFDLNFEGGSVEEFLRVLDDAVGRPINVILNPELKETPIPPMRLRQITVPQLFEAVATSSGKEFFRRSRGPGMAPPMLERVQYSHGFRASERSPSTDSIWVFYRQNPPEEMAATESPAVPAREVRVINLTPVLEGRSVEDITTAIRTATDMVEGVAPMALTFHKETQLLISRGTSAQLEVLERVLAEIASSPAPVAKAKPTPFQMSPELMKRYGLLPPAPQPAPPKE